MEPTDPSITTNLVAITELLNQIKALLNTKHLKRIEGKVIVSRTHIRDGQTVSETSKETKLKARTFATQPATISYNFGRTISMPNYESLKVGVMITVPCYTEEIRQVAPEIEAFGEELITKLVNKTRKAPKNAQTEEV